MARKPRPSSQCVKRGLKLINFSTRRPISFLFDVPALLAYIGSRNTLESRIGFLELQGLKLVKLSKRRTGE